MSESKRRSAEILDLKRASTQTEHKRIHIERGPGIGGQDVQIRNTK